MKMIPHPSPNFNERDGQPVDMLVMHYTGMMTAEGALAKLCDPVAKVSAHYLVDEDGTIYQLVPEEKRAWHAGVSFWRGHTNINQRSIGIEIVNPGHEYGYRPFPQAQMDAVAALSKDIIARHAIPARNVVGHSDVAPERKEDPGELFDWKWLAEQEAGIFPSPRRGEAGRGALLTSELNNAPTLNPPPVGEGRLAKYGYSTTNLPKTILAFQRHFRPKLLTSLWDQECALILQALLDSEL